MTANATSLGRLALALDGVLPDQEQWFDLIEIANKGWLGPALFLALKRAGSLGQVPEEPRAYLALLHDRNRERNLRLKSQLLEAVGALNAHDIEPIILKGAIHLLTCRDENLGERMISDLDISIDPPELPSARAALLPLGYANAPSDRELARPDDAGLLEFHLKPSGRSSRYLSGDLRSSCRTVRQDGVVALIPSATSRALHLIVHDMIKEGDYWRLRLDLRHLKDLADLARSPQGVRWGEVNSALGDRAGRLALQVQLQMLKHVFGVPIDPRQLDTRAARLLHRARLTAIGDSRSGVPVRAAANLWWGIHRAFNGYSWRGFRNLAGRTRNVFIEPAKGSRV